MQGSGKFMHNTFWHEGQIVFTFQLAPGVLPASSSSSHATRPVIPVFSKESVIRLLNLPGLARFLADNGFTLSPFTMADIARSSTSTSLPSEVGAVTRTADMQADFNTEVGKFVFTTLDAERNFVPTAIGFFHFHDTGSMVMDGTMNDGSDGMSSRIVASRSPVPRLVNFINQNLARLKKEFNIPIVAASPNWLSGGTSPTSEGVVGSKGCPLTPSMPVKGDAVCSSSPGLWPIILPDLPKELQPMVGDGVTVCILDTLPVQGRIIAAAAAAEADNLLLLDVANNVKFNYQILPDILDIPNPQLPVTGKDVFGRLVGFQMPDHGLFVAGIIRDLAPGANIECIRVLNDECVGDLATLTAALESIHNRMLFFNPDTRMQGDLFSKPVVINMSLVITPTDEEAQNVGLLAAFLQEIRQAVQKPMQSLANFGIIFAASAGNEGDLRYTPANPTGVRPNALHPSAFAYDPIAPIDAIIPVGAVDKNGNAASYSCYPGPRGVATYGGEVPEPEAHKVGECFTQVKKPLDAMIGIYTSLRYPAPSIDDCRAYYPIPNAHGWAYWVGTSFATPIVSAITAQVMELQLRGKLPAGVSVPQAVLDVAGANGTNWTRLDPSINGGNPLFGPVIRAMQCKPILEKEDEDSVEEDATTVVNIIEAPVAVLEAEQNKN